MVSRRGCGGMGVSLTISSSSNLEVSISQNKAACEACKAPRVEFLTRICFEVLAFNTAVAGVAQGSVELVVMSLAVRRVLEDVELGCGEGVGTFSADKAVLVVPPSKATRRVLDRLSYNGLGATAAVALASSFGSLGFRLP